MKTKPVEILEIFTFFNGGHQFIFQENFKIAFCLAYTSLKKIFVP